MTTQVIDRLAELNPYIQELASLSSLEHPTRQQNTRMTSLMSIISALKAGSTLAEVKSWEIDELRKAAGLSRLPERPRTSSLGEEIEASYRRFGATGECRETFIPHPKEIRANEAGTQSLSLTQGVPGGYFVPQGFSDRAFETMKTYDAIFDPQFSNIYETATGSNMPFPVWSDVDGSTSNDSVQVGESNISTEVDVASFGTTQLNSYAFRSKIVGVSLELLQDSQFPIGSILERVFAARHARGVGRALITGSGVNAPTGLLTGVVASGVTPTIASGSGINDGSANSGSNSIGTQDINKLYHSLEKAYRPGACFYATDNTVKLLEGLLDKNGRPIVSFRKGLTGYDNDIPCMMGKPIAVCPSMPEISNGTSPIIFGSPTYFIFRKIPSSMYIRRFWQNPTLVQYGLVGFESWMRVDSGVIAPNAAHAPFQFIQCHS
jgi:HK97 family phage major capsid protein